VKFLLSDEIRGLYPNIDPACNYNYAIKFASKNGHVEVVKFLLSDEIRTRYPRINPSADNNFAMGWAYLSGHLEIIKILSEDQRVHNIYSDEEKCFID
jgi:ankyrin repeat protein